MKTSKTFLIQRIVDKLQSGNNRSIKMSLNNVHAPGLFSLVVDGEEPGKLLRIFIADQKLRPFEVQLHTHRYPINLTVIKGVVKQHTAEEVEYIYGDAVSLSKYEYRSFLNGGKGLSYEVDGHYKLSEFTIPVGGTIHMGTEEFHTVSCSKGSIWIVEELGFETEKSLVLGVPFVVDQLYIEPQQFQLNDKIQQVLVVVKRMLDDYRRVEL